MADAPEGGGPGKATPEMLESLFVGAAPIANRSFVTLTPGGIRLTFSEQVSSTSPLHFRAAVFLDYAQAIGLRDLLTRNLAPIETEFREAEAQAQAAMSGEKPGHGS